MSSASLWQSILATNAAEISPLLRDMARQLGAAADQLDAGHDVSELLDKAKRARELL
jgi:hypothetical protein